MSIDCGCSIRALATACKSDHGQYRSTLRASLFVLSRGTNDGVNLMRLCQHTAEVVCSAQPGAAGMHSDETVEQRDAWRTSLNLQDIPCIFESFSPQGGAIDAAVGTYELEHRSQCIAGWD